MNGSDRPIAWSPILTSVRRQMGEDRGDDRDRNALRLMKIQRSRIVHVAQGKPSILIHLLFF